MLNLAAQVRENEAGNQLYTLCKDGDGNYVVLELYETAEDLAARTSHRDRLLGTAVQRVPQLDVGVPGNVNRRFVEDVCAHDRGT